MIDLDRLHDKKYRMNNLYHIIDKTGRNIQFVMNDTQEDVFNNIHSKSLILKARQIGMSTFCILYLLDEIIFNYNKSAGIISYSLPHAQHIFKNIVRHAITYFPKELKPIGIIAESTKELTLNNGSHFRVDTSLRGGTTHLVLITEFGKTCARSPIRSDEIIAGTLESVPLTGTILIESTGEGTSGPFTEMCLAAAARGNDNIIDQDYKLFFYPWYTDKSYSIETLVDLDIETSDYFHKIEKELSMKFSNGQKWWYQKKKELLKDKMQQEYPSTVDEAFVSNSEAFYFAKALQEARRDERIVQSDLYDPLLPCYVSADIGVTDKTVLTFFQQHHGEIRIIDVYADSNKSLDFYVTLLLKDKPYNYHTIFLPHDAVKKDGIIVENSYESEFRRLMQHTGTLIKVLQRTDRNVSIGNATSSIRKCVFAEKKCRDYIVHLTKYRKKWSEQLNRFVDQPYHDIHSDYADSFRYAMQAVKIVEREGEMTGALSKHLELVNSKKKLW